MSACISSQGEYGDHIHDGSEFVCSRCFVFDEYGALKEIANARHDTAQAVAIEREAIAALAEVKGQELGRESHRLRDYGHPSDSWAPVAHASEVLRNLAQAIRSGEHVKP